MLFRIKFSKSSNSDKGTVAEEKESNSFFDYCGLDSSNYNSIEGDTLWFCTILVRYNLIYYLSQQFFGAMNYGTIL